MLEILINPPILTPWLNHSERERNVILLDLLIDQNENSEKQIDLDLAFNSISIRRGSVEKSDYYIGTVLPPKISMK